MPRSVPPGTALASKMPTGTEMGAGTGTKSTTGGFSGRQGPIDLDLPRVSVLRALLGFRVDWEDAGL